MVSRQKILIVDDDSNIAELITGLKHWIMTIRIQKIKRNLRQIKLLIYIKTLTVINGVIC